MLDRRPSESTFSQDTGWPESTTSRPIVAEVVQPIKHVESRPPLGSIDEEKARLARAERSVLYDRDDSIIDSILYDRPLPKKTAPAARRRGLTACDLRAKV